MTHKERMLIAYRGEQPDRVPIAPELWFLVPAKIMKVPFYEVGGPISSIPLWRAQLEAAKYFDVVGWIVPNLGSAYPDRYERKCSKRDDGRIEVTVIWHADEGDFREVIDCFPDDASWDRERPAKKIEDFEKLKPLLMEDPWGMDVSEVEEAVKETGGQGVVEIGVGLQFFDFIAVNREGGPTQAIYDFYDYPDYLRKLHDEYVEYVREMTRMVIARTRADVVFIANAYSSLGVISPKMFKEWNIPGIKAVVEEAHQKGKLVHIHQHGYCLGLMDYLVEAEVDAVCPLERPPGGDVVDLGEVKRRWGDKIALKGNVHTIDVLLNGTPEDVERQVKECIASAGEGGGFILGTGDQVARDTSFENIWAYVEAGNKYGKYPLIDLQ